MRVDFEGEVKVKGRPYWAQAQYRVTWFGSHDSNCQRHPVVEKFLVWDGGEEGGWAPVDPTIREDAETAIEEAIWDEQNAS